ncbi:hypothetical protein niasHT_038905 [Heterodera trifolii]|uniref:Uncharacterized protein n=1 Tax=Heterodera trifolii TaxID=157864 RepID=A0ABD2IW86_9BILA
MGYPNTLNNGQFEIKCHLYSVDIRDEADGAVSPIGIRKAFRIVLECQGQITPWSFTVEMIMMFSTTDDFGSGPEANAFPPESYAFAHNLFELGNTKETVYDNCEPIVFEALLNDQQIYNRAKDSVDLIIGIKAIGAFDGLRCASPHHIPAKNAEWNSGAEQSSNASDGNSEIEGYVPTEMSEFNLVDPGLELTDPNPDVLALFREYDQRFFQGRLTQSGVMIGWNNKLLRYFPFLIGTIS